MIDTKEYKNYVKHHGADLAKEFVNKTSEELKKTISYCIVEIRKETEAVKETPEYQRSKENIKIFNDSLNEVIKPLRAAIDLATLILKEKQ